MRRSTVFRFAKTTIALALIGGCGERSSPTSPTAQVAPTAQAPSNVQGLSTGAIVKRTITLTADVSTSVVVTPQGGWLEIPDAGLVMYFPQGAVSSDLTVTATAHNGNKVVYSFEPHGTVFNTPIYVAQLLKNTELNTPRNKNRVKPWAGYLPDGLADVADDGTGYFAEVFGAEFYGKGNDTYAVFATTHFSGYALASGRCTTPTQ